MTYRASKYPGGLNGQHSRHDQEHVTDMTRSLRNNHLLRQAYELGYRNGFDELEILKRFTLMLLDLKDEAFQEKIDKLMRSPAQPIFKTDA